MVDGSITARFKRALRFAATFVVAIWLIKCLDWFTPLALRQYGILPRDIAHLSSILFAPLIHGSLSHLMANTPALLVLGTSILFGYPKAAKIVIPAIWILSGLGVWLFAQYLPYRRIRSHVWHDVFCLHGGHHALGPASDCLVLPGVLFIRWHDLGNIPR